MNIIDVRKLAWDRKEVVKFLRTIAIGSVKSAHQLTDEFIASFGVEDNSSEWYNVLNNMCAGFDYLLNLGDVTMVKNDEGLPILTFVKNSGFSPR
ncbi:hypothetical protein M12a_00008 [Klebsiella phage VLCpiM12a]|uniref:hypothetical protein n=1 Tax=Klebsiella phage VLCpiM12a TaxID=2874879 RepID=UPI00232B9DA5|nr:hypothetical protein PQZ58_gp08 [Klebsiella phage VLCpiM12a]UVX31519.1 hypothetical protein M12a_00008 [Klebsiella phage VLCpiM12a]